MKLLKIFVGIFGVIFYLVSCSTPITDPTMLNELTTCRHGSLEKVKKNLMLMGYEIAESDDQMIVTNFKQEGTKLDQSKIYSMVNVIKVSDNQIKFKVRERRLYETQEADKGVVISAGSYKNRGSTNTFDCSGVYGYGSCYDNSSKVGKLEATSYKTVTKTDDYDRKYYQKREAIYRDFKNQVCGM